MEILLFGKNGQLGSELHPRLGSLGTVTALSIEDLDLEQFDLVRRKVREVRPSLIVNAAAYTAVDKAESEREAAFRVNGELPGVLAEEAKALDATLVHYSTDYVFDGNKGTAYVEDDLPNPLSVYGASKLAGEQAIQSVGGHFLIFRTSWVYSLMGGGFVAKVLEWSRKQESMRVVNDQVSNPTWARTLAEATTRILSSAPGVVRAHSGLYHLAGGGYASRFEWAKSILEFDPQRSEQVVKELLPGLTRDFPTPATRPLFSALDCSQIEREFDLTLAPWQDILRQAMASKPST